MKIIKVWLTKYAILLFLLLFLLSCRVLQKQDENESEAILNIDNPINKEEKNELHYYAVVNVDRLRFRKENSVNSEVLEYLKKGDILTVEERKTEKVKIGDMDGYWYKVKKEDNGGWVFGYFIDLFTDYNEAINASNDYLSHKENSQNANDYAYFSSNIDNNLFFIKQGKIYKVISGYNKNFESLDIPKDIFVESYKFANDKKGFYFLGRLKAKSNNLTSIYYYGLLENKIRLISKDQSHFYINQDNSIIVSLVKERKLNSFLWSINLINLNDNKFKNVAKIKVNSQYIQNKFDFFTRTLERELGSLISLKLSEQNNYIFFKPPEENLTTLISLYNGNYMQVEQKESPYYIIDDAFSIATHYIQQDDGKTMYSILLKDRYSGQDNEIYQSALYPLNYYISPKKDLLAITMIDSNKTIGNFYHSAIYVLSLSTYTMYNITSDGESFHPEWLN